MFKLGLDTWRTRWHARGRKPRDNPVIAHDPTFSTPVLGDSVPVFGAENVESPERHQQYLRRVRRLLV